MTDKYKGYTVLYQGRWQLIKVSRATWFGKEQYCRGADASFDIRQQRYAAVCYSGESTWEPESLEERT